MDRALTQKLKKIKFVAMDFDGVMTDGFVYVDERGREMVRASRKDGLGINLLQGHGIAVGVISKETNPVVRARCRKLKIPCWQGIRDGEGKRAILQRILRVRKLSRTEVCYIGDDVNDLEALRAAGVGITVADGHPLLKQVADYVTKAMGGAHAVREVAELILRAHGIPIRF